VIITVSLGAQSYSIVVEIGAVASAGERRWGSDAGWR
jgi:hypothetical protein